MAPVAVKSVLPIHLCGREIVWKYAEIKFLIMVLSFFRETK